MWEFRDQQKPKFSIATVLPVYVLGPQAYDANVSQLTSTASWFASGLQAKKREDLESVIMLNFGVDVRDVARAHIVGAENEAAHGKRLSLSSGVFNADTILTILAEKFPGKSELKPNDPVTPLVPDLVHNKATRAILGDLISPEVSIADAAEQFFRVTGA